MMPDIRSITTSTLEAGEDLPPKSGTVKTAIDAVNSDITAIEGDVSAIETDIAAIETDVAAIETNIDSFGISTNDVYYNGSKISSALADANNKLAIVIMENGTCHIFKPAFRGLSGLTINISADGYIEFDASQTELESINFENSEIIDDDRSLLNPSRLEVTKAWGADNADGSFVPSFYETVDGSIWFVKPAFRGLNGLNITRNADGYIEFDGQGLTFSTLTMDDGAEIVSGDTRYYGSQEVSHALISEDEDEQKIAALIVQKNGTVYIPKLTAPALDNAGASAAIDTTSHIFSEGSIGDFRVVTRINKLSGVKSTATPTDSNAFSPRLSEDGTKILYLTDRNGSLETWYQTLSGAKFGGSVEHPVIPNRPILALGDSLTAADYATVVAAAVGTSLLHPSGGPETGIGSQTADQIAARYGAVALTCSITSNQISSGDNLLTAISLQLLSRHSDGSGTVRTLRATIAGVNGVLKSTQSPTSVAGALTFSGQWYSYVFTPDAGQSLPVSVSAGVTLTIDPEARQDSTLLLWMGRNNVTGANTTWITEVVNRIAEVVAVFKPLVRQIVIIGVTNTTSEPSGSSAHTNIVSLNTQLAALYPDNFLDVRPIYNAGTADDTPAPSLSDDGTHYNVGAGRTAIGNAVANFIISKGWYS